MIDKFLDLFLNATALIPPIYFQLPVAGREKPIFRERVYCYELYHQLRVMLDQNEDARRYALSGEIDKQGHPIIRQCAPDLLFHQPGDMRENIAAVEVKPANGDPEGIQKDLETLTYFVNDTVQYQLGIHLVYGGTEPSLAKFVEAFQAVDARKLRLYWHSKVGEAATRIR